MEGEIEKPLVRKLKRGWGNENQGVIKGWGLLSLVPKITRKKNTTHQSRKKKRKPREINCGTASSLQLNNGERKKRVAMGGRG